MMDVLGVKYEKENYNGNFKCISCNNLNNRMFSNSRFKSRINTANNNWLEIPIEDVIESILNYFEELTVSFI